MVLVCGSSGAARVSGPAKVINKLGYRNIDLTFLKKFFLNFGKIDKIIRTARSIGKFAYGVWERENGRCLR